MKLQSALIALLGLAMAQAAVMPRSCSGSCELLCDAGYVADSDQTCADSSLTCCVPEDNGSGGTIEIPDGSCGLNKYDNKEDGRFRLASPYIVGGEKARVNEFPWQVSMQKNSFPSCGGSIINNRWIMCAAHCFSSTSVSSYSIVVGMHDRYETIEGQDRLKVDRIIKHEQYNSRNYLNDIALLRLEKELTFSQSVQPVCLPEAAGYDVEGKWVEATGWGTTSSGGVQPRILQKVSVPVISNQVCDNMYSKRGYKIYDSMICAGDTANGGIDSCQGDSGGPLQYHNADSNRYEQVGIVSWGIGCALADYPGVYTRVSEHLDWIEDTITKNSD